MIDTLQIQIEETLAHAEPDVDVLLAEVVGGSVLRVFIDHPDGVTLALCERVTRELGELREEYSLEVSSPGRDRPLTKPSHFRTYVGRRARVRVRENEGLRDRTAEGGVRRGPRSLTGELVGATDREVTLAAEEGVIAIPYADIRRCNLVEE
jgi:ribosome maturation factor RimP